MTETTTPQDVLDALLQDQRRRAGYRTLLQHADEELRLDKDVLDDQDLMADVGDPDFRRELAERITSRTAALEEQRQATRDHALRMVRTGKVPREHHAALTEHLLTAARQEINQRPLRAAQRQHLSTPTPTPDGPVLTIDPQMITETQREEHNALAYALAFPRTRSRGMLGEVADPDTAKLVDANTRLQSAQRLCVRYTLTGMDQLALHHAHQAQDAEAEYQALHDRITRERRRNLKHRAYQDGDTYHVQIEGIDMVFHIDVYWDARGTALEVEASSARGIERRTGIPVGQGWRSLTRWILDTDQRHREGTGTGRRADRHALIWEPREGAAHRLRPDLGRYPGLLAALEALRCSLVIPDWNPIPTSSRNV